MRIIIPTADLERETRRVPAALPGWWELWAGREGTDGLKLSGMLKNTPHVQQRLGNSYLSTLIQAQVRKDLECPVASLVLQLTAACLG